MENLLLACKYCNTRKSNKTTSENKNDYLWPDENNTELAYTYAGGIPRVNSPILLELDPSGNIAQKAENFLNWWNLETFRHQRIKIDASNRELKRMLRPGFL